MGLERGGSAAPGGSAGGRPRLLPSRFERCRLLPRVLAWADAAAASSAPPQLSAWRASWDEGMPGAEGMAAHMAAAGGDPYMGGDDIVGVS